MKSFLTAVLVAALATSATAAVIGSPSTDNSPSKVRREALCTATVTGSNAEGGGGGAGEYQSNENTNTYAFNIVGPNGKKTDAIWMNTEKDGNLQATEQASAYGGTFDTTCSGDWDGFNNSWYSCECNKVPGAVQKDHIDTDIVSTTTDNCIVVYDC